MTSLAQNRKRYQEMLKNKYQQNRPSRREVTGMNEASSSSDDDEESMDELELEQERILSEKFGEAGEASTPSSKNKKRKKQDKATTSDEFQNDKFAQKQAKLKEVTAKKARPTITAAQLISGRSSFITLKNELKDDLCWGRLPSSDPAARFSTDLINMYKTYCYNLCPSLSFEDALSRIQKLSSSKEMRNHLQSMRQDVCRDYLVRQHGLEKTEKLLQDLDEYQATLLSSNGDEYENEETELPLEENPSKEKESITNKKEKTISSQKVSSSTIRAKNNYQKKKAISESEDEEEEANFDDIVGKSKPDEE